MFADGEGPKSLATAQVIGHLYDLRFKLAALLNEPIRTFKCDYIGGLKLFRDFDKFSNTEAIFKTTCLGTRQVFW
jgi:hypothetical protein